ncbi:MAG: DivIVA domain-containing protein [Lacisediminihabitans sp.]
MALTPEDVVNKRFQPTKFREGYDQDEVDDFLDEVVVELRRLNQENEELRQRLIAGESRINELQRSAAQAPSQAPVFGDQAQAIAPVAVPMPVAPAPAPAPAYSNSATDPNLDPNNTNNLLQLARRLHEEHVREGIEKRDALIAEGQATAARLVGEAENTQRTQLASLDQERTQLEKSIDELRTFEREYRQKLKNYIEGQLRDLDSTNSVGGGQAQETASFGAVNTAPPASYQGFGGN